MKNLKKLKMVMLIVVAVIIFGIIVAILFGNKEEKQVSHKDKIKEKIKKEGTEETDVLPTLIDPITKDSCWCGTFQLVWNDMKNKVVKGDVVFTPQVKIADNLKKETFTEEMLSEDHYYKTYGLKTLELKKKIEKGIKKKFNQDSDILDDFDWSEDSLDKNGTRYFFYTMLYRKFEFLNKFDKLDKGTFGKEGKEAEFFGITSDTNEKVGKQIEVLFYNSEDDFAIVLNTKENDEVIFYKNPKGNTFMDIYKNMNKQADLYTGSKSFGNEDTFKAPCLQINLKKNYDEICNKEFRTNNSKIPVAIIVKAMQTVKFSLDEKGGEVKSEAAIEMKDNCVVGVENNLRNFAVDDTFTLFLREEGKDMPYFAMNVDDISIYQ